MTDRELISLVGEEYLPGFYNGRLIPHGPFWEEWKEIENTSGHYYISNYGRLKSISRLVKTGLSDYMSKEVIMRTNKPSMRYSRVYITFNNEIKRRFIPVHKYVALYFVPNPNNKPDVNHIRGFKQDNVFNQIEWVTPKENMQHSFHFLKQKSVKGQTRTNLRKYVIATNLATNEQTEYFGITEAIKNGFNGTVISLCLSGKKLTHKNHTWRLA